MYESNILTNIMKDKVIIGGGGGGGGGGWGGGGGVSPHMLEQWR